MPVLNLKTTDLQLGDIVEVFEGPFGTATVVKITDDGNLSAVTFQRPYGQTSDCRYGDSVIHWQGLETFSRPRTDVQTWKVWQRKDYWQGEEALRHDSEMREMRTKLAVANNVICDLIAEVDACQNGGAHRRARTYAKSL